MYTPCFCFLGQANPGPADYETNVSSFKTETQQTLTDVEIAFGSSDARYCLSETRTDYDAGPGDTHEDTDKMFGALGRSAGRFKLRSPIKPTAYARTFWQATSYWISCAWVPKACSEPPTLASRFATSLMVRLISAIGAWLCSSASVSGAHCQPSTRFTFCSNCTQPGTKVDGSKILETPGVGSLALKKPQFQRVRASGMFKSRSSRMPRVSTNLPPDFVKVIPIFLLRYFSQCFFLIIVSSARGALDRQHHSRGSGGDRQSARSGRVRLA